MDITGKTLIAVDIQPEYKDWITFNLDEYVQFINSNFDAANNVIFLYNGYDTLGMIKEEEYKNWFWERGLEENIIDGIIWIDKGYAYLKYCIDNFIDEDNVVNFVKFMYQNDIGDSRDMDRNQWKMYIKQYGKTDVHDLLEKSKDMIYIPDLMKDLKKYNNIVMCGGGINECLKEVEICLRALDKSYTLFKKFVY
jgi:hypothetical protein